MRQVFYGFWTVEFGKLVNVPGNALRVMAVAKKDSENTDKDMHGHPLFLLLPRQVDGGLDRIHRVLLRVPGGWAWRQKARSIAPVFLRAHATGSQARLLERG